LLGTHLPSSSGFRYALTDGLDYEPPFLHISLTWLFGFKVRTSKNQTRHGCVLSVHLRLSVLQWVQVIPSILPQKVLSIKSFSFGITQQPTPSSLSIPFFYRLLGYISISFFLFRIFITWEGQFQRCVFQSHRCQGDSIGVFIVCLLSCSGGFCARRRCVVEGLLGQGKKRRESCLWSLPGK